jgi:hypothetical protein
MLLKLKVNMTKQRLQTFQHSENRHSSCSEGLNTEIPGWQICVSYRSATALMFVRMLTSALGKHNFLQHTEGWD